MAGVRVFPAPKRGLLSWRFGIAKATPGDETEMTRLKLHAFVVLLLIVPAAFANVYGAIRGVVHDPQHRPIQDAMVMLHAKSSEWAKSVTTDATGEFQF